MAAPRIDIHTPDEAENQAVIASLQVNQLDPKLLYVTTRQAELWRQVFLKHSPLQYDPNFARLYRETFATLAPTAPKKVHLVGLGCGTGAKELELATRLRASGCEVVFSAIDVSCDLVTESVARLTAVGATHECSLVCDLTDTASISKWLDDASPGLPRWITFFGLVPNFTPSQTAAILRAVLRPGDQLLVSAHLVPVQSPDPDELPAAMRAVLPQYNNSETLTWLTAALEELELENQVQSPTMRIGEIEAMPAFLGEANWKPGATFEKGGRHFSARVEEPLRLFGSLRYTPTLFEEFLQREGFEFELLALTPCRQEGLWRITVPQVRA